MEGRILSHSIHMEGPFDISSTALFFLDFLSCDIDTYNFLYLLNVNFNCFPWTYMIIKLAILMFVSVGDCHP